MPDYPVSKVHLLFVDSVLWFFHMILVAITVEEAKCRLDPARPNPLDAMPEEAAEAETSSSNRDSIEDDVHEHLLPQDNHDFTADTRSEDRRDVLPTTRTPIAYVRWESLWASEPSASE